MNNLKNKNQRGFTQIVDFCDVILSRTRSASQKFTTGFTLVETLVSIAIFSAAVLSLMVVLGGGISNTTYAKQKMVAGYLAAEGIEQIRNMRDTYSLQNSTTGWATFNTELNSNECDDRIYGCYSDDDKLFSGVSVTLASCNSTACPYLLYDASSGKYNYLVGENSGFIRKIHVEEVGGNSNELKIYSTVSWEQGSGSHSVTLSTNLIDWQSENPL